MVFALALLLPQSICCVRSIPAQGNRKIVCEALDVTLFPAP